MHLIAGIDPGTTTGIAVLDFNGKTVDVLSSKDLGLDKTIKHLITLGKVSLIATDVNPTPGFVSKLAAQLGCVVYTPQESLIVNEKINLTRGYDVDDSHQRDALAAALTAFSKFRNKFRKIDSLGLAEEEDVKHLVLHGLSIDKALKRLRNEEEDADMKKAAVKEKPVTKLISDEERWIRRLEKQNLVLKEQIHEGEGEIRELRDTISRVKKQYNAELRKDFEVRKREQNIRNLRYRLSDLEKKLMKIRDLKKLWRRVAEGEILPVGVFPEQTSGLVWIKRRLKKMDLDKLCGIRIAFTDDKVNKKLLRNKDVTSADTGYLNELEGCGYVYAKDLGHMETEKESVSLEEVIKDYRAERV